MIANPREPQGGTPTAQISDREIIAQLVPYRDYFPKRLLSIYNVYLKMWI